MKNKRDPSNSPPSEKLYLSQKSPRDVVRLRKKTLPKKASTVLIPMLSQEKSSENQLTERLRITQQQMLSQQSGGNVYIPLSGCHDSGYQGSLVLEDEVNKFLADRTKKVMLLTGHSGSGKSLFTQGFVAKLWGQYKEGDPIPLWISLPNCKQPETKAIEETLLKCGFDHDQIEALRNTQRFNFIFDAVDEIRCLKNLWMSNNLAHWNASSIFTCRHEYLYWMENFKNLFTPIVDDRLNYAALEVLYVKPFSAEQIEDYAKHYIQQHDTIWKQWEDYQRAFTEIPGLKELIQTPYVLKLAVEALPGIIKRYEGVEPEKKKENTKVVLYDVFVGQWFSRQERKLKDTGIIFEDESIEEEFWDYAKSLARLMHEQQVSQILYEPTEADVFDMDAKTADESPFSQFFDPSRPRVQLLQTSCFVRQTGVNLFAFSHASLLDYFIAKGTFDTALANNSDQIEVLGYSTKEDPINISLFTEAQISLLAERVKDSGEFKESLLGWVYSSRNNPQNVVGSANAITVLVKAGITFNGADLSYLYLRRANISGGYFDRANFEGCDLQDVMMHRVWMRQANLRRCNLKGIDFGEYSWIEHNSPIHSIIHREDQNTLVIGSELGVSFWNLNTKRYVDSLEAPKDIRTMAMSQDGQIVVNYSDTILYWDKNHGTVQKITARVNTAERVNTGCLSIRPNGKSIFYGDGFYLKMIDIIDISLARGGIGSINVKNVATFERYIWNLNFSKDGNKLVIGESKGKLSILELKDNKISTIQGHTDRVTTACLNSNGTIAVSGSKDTTVRLWNVLSGNSKVFHGHVDAVLAVCLCEDTNSVVSSSSDKTIRIWDISTGAARILYGHSEAVRAVSMSPNRRILVSGSDDLTVRFWNVENLLVEQTKTEHEFLECSELCGNTLIMVSPKTKMKKVFDALTLQFKFIQTSLDDRKYKLFSNGQKIISYKPGDEKSVNIFNIFDNTTIKSIEHINSIYNVVASTDGKFIAIHSSKTLQIWNLETNESTIISSDVVPHCISSDGKIIVEKRISRIKLFDVESRLQKILYTTEEEINTCCMSEDGEIVVSGGNDMKIIVYFVKTDEKIELIGHAAYVEHVYLSENKNIIISWGRDKSLRIWDLQTKSMKNAIYFDLDVAQISLKNNLQVLTIRFYDGSAQYWEGKNEEGTDWQLMWSSNFGCHNKVLNLQDSETRGSIGLSWPNQELLSQRRAGVVNNSARNLVAVGKHNRSPIHIGEHREKYNDEKNDNKCVLF